MQIMLSIVKLAILSFLLFWLVRYWVLINREYRDQLVRNYKHGWPYRFALWKNFKAIVIDGTKAAWRGEDLPQSIPFLKCSYKTLVVSMNKVTMICLKFLFTLMYFNKKNSHLVKYTDATDIPVCLKKNADDHKTMKDLAGFGRSAKGWFYGLKMTMTRDHDGRMLSLRFTLPSTNDRNIFRDINADIEGIIVSDAGYVSKQLEKDMYLENKRWILIRPYKTMKKLMTAWQYHLYKGRFKIEFDFRSLKMFHGLVTSLPRSVNGYLANYIHALTSFVLA